MDDETQKAMHARLDAMSARLDAVEARFHAMKTPSPPSPPPPRKDYSRVVPPVIHSVRVDVPFNDKTTNLWGIYAGKAPIWYKADPATRKTRVPQEAQKNILDYAIGLPGDPKVQFGSMIMEANIFVDADEVEEARKEQEITINGVPVYIWPKD